MHVARLTAYPVITAVSIVDKQEPFVFKNIYHPDSLRRYNIIVLCYHAPRLGHDARACDG